jgi:hypothetical protein
MELSFHRDLGFMPETDANSLQTLTESSRIRRENVLIIGVALIAFWLKLAIAYNTFGTNDVASFYMFAGSLRDHGLEWTYRNGVIFFSNFPVFNHPPLTAYYLELIGNLSRSTLLQDCGITFPFLVRFPGIVADLIVVLILMRIRALIPRRQIPTWAILLFALSPVSIMVSGFHGNTDPIMVMFLLLAVYMCLLEQPIWCGIFFALSCQIKIIPLLLVPIVFCFWLNRRAATRFVVPFSLLTAMLWIQPLSKFPTLFLRNVFLYNSYWGSWGISYWLKLTQWPQFSGGFFNLPTGAAIATWILKIVIIWAVIIIAWRRRDLRQHGVIDSLAYGWIVFFIFSPGICPQYMVWLAPFILLLSPRVYGWLTAASSLSLFFLYNSLTGGLPWFICIARNNLATSDQSAPWFLWPWATLIFAAILLSKNASLSHSSLAVESE